MLTKKQKQQRERANRCCSARIGVMKVLCNHCYVVANCLTYDFVSDCFGIYLILVVVIGSGIFQVVVKMFVDWIQLSLHSYRRHVIRPNSNNFLHLPGICTISRPFSRSTLGQPTTHGGRRSNSIFEFYDRDTNGNVLEEGSTAALVLHCQVGRCSILMGLCRYA